MLAVPLAVAAQSPLLAWRQPVYIVSSFAGILGLGLIFLQPLLTAGALPGLPARQGRHLHRRVGTLLVAAVVVHVGGLWITSPPDVIDALTFTSPTPFSDWGVIAMWALFAAAALAVARDRMRLRPRTWRLAHSGLVAVAAIGTVAHALLIEGIMGPVSKVALCALALAALARTLHDLRTWTLLRRRALQAPRGNAPRRKKSG